MTLREELIDFVNWSLEEGDKYRGENTTEGIIDAYLKSKDSSQPNGGDRVVSENEKQEEEFDDDKCIYCQVNPNGTGYDLLYCEDCW